MNSRLIHHVFFRFGVCLLLACILTIFIFKNGGAHNPFSILFIVLCSVAAMSLPRAYLISVIAVSLFCLGMIYSVGAEHAGHLGSDFGFHLRGMWIANSIGVVVVSFWIHFLRMQNDKMAEKHRATQGILFQLERVESMGRMLAATAHQLNTPLATVQLGISELEDQSRPLSPDEKKLWLGDMQRALDQILAVTGSLKPGDVLEDKETGQPIELIGFLETLISRWAATRDVPVVLTAVKLPLKTSTRNIGEISSVIEALLENAFDARRPDAKPKITVSLQVNSAEVIICIADDGIGMSKDTQTRAIEPLFTTKQAGTGLGLYIAYQLAKRLGGALNIETEPGKGTTVTLTFLKAALA